MSATTPMENVRLRFPRVDDGQFARDLSNAQREAAKLEPKIEALAAILRQGERDRDKITTPRWQAGFDLAIGRALAVKVRTEGYNAMLAIAKQGMKFKDEQNDTWELKPSDSVTVSSALWRRTRRTRRNISIASCRPQGDAVGDGRREGTAPAARLGVDGAIYGRAGSGRASRHESQPPAARTAAAAARSRGATRRRCDRRGRFF